MHRQSTRKVKQSAVEPHIEGVLQSATKFYGILQGAVQRLSIEYKELQSTAKSQADGKSGVTMMGSKTVAAGDHGGGRQICATPLRGRTPEEGSAGGVDTIRLAL